MTPDRPNPPRRFRPPPRPPGAGGVAFRSAFGGAMGCFVAAFLVFLLFAGCTAVSRARRAADAVDGWEAEPPRPARVR